MTDTIRHEIPDYEVGIAQKRVHEASREGAVQYVDHTNWERIARRDGKSGVYGFVWWCVGVAVIAVTVTWSAS